MDNFNNSVTVTEVNRYIKSLFTDDPNLVKLFVHGEVSNCKYHSSGHIYFSLKDADSTLNCIMFSYSRKHINFQMKDGQQLVVYGNISLYERSGSYRMVIQDALLYGAGRLFEEFERLKAFLKKEGLFAQSHKQAIPFYSRKIGIVTAPTGAAIQDIRNVSMRRNPYIQLILYPAKVQGDGAADTIVKGIHALEKTGVDVIIVGRGGGSIEDLWAFNEEKVARAIFECQTPVISAVGHETDTTITDFAADLRAPTPSAAAELAVCDIRTMLQQLGNLRTKLEQAMFLKLGEQRARFLNKQKLLMALRLQNLLFERRMLEADVRSQLEKLISERIKACKEKIAEYEASFHPSWMERKVREYKVMEKTFSMELSRMMTEKLNSKKAAFELYIEKLHGLSPIQKLKSGYSYTEDLLGNSVTSIDQVAIGSMLQVRVMNGTYITVVEGKEGEKLIRG